MMLYWIVVYISKNHPNSLTIILSNDKNLCSKALMNELLTVSFRPNMSGELIAKLYIMKIFKDLEK